MKITLAQIANVAPVIETIMVAKLPARSAYRISKLAQAIGAEFALYEQQRIALVRRLGEDDGKSGIRINKRESIEEFLSEMQPLNATEVEINDVLTIEDLEKIDLTAVEMSLLEPFIRAEQAEN